MATLIGRRHLGRVVEKCPVEQGCGCDFLSRLPRDKTIDFGANLNGTKVQPWKHLVILSHGFKLAEEWPSKMELVPGTLGNHIASMRRGILSPYHPVLVSYAIVPGLMELAHQKVILYPENRMVEFDLDQTRSFMQTYLTPPAHQISEESVYNPFKREEKVLVAENVVLQESVMAKDLILVCGHTQRDIRCGMIAPLLVEKFRNCLNQRNLHNIEVGYVSHVGGHAYAGNVIYFPREPMQPSIWYGRVFPQHVAGIVDETVVKKNIIKELYRGVL